jgi:penicillin-binding protein 1A
MSLGAGETTVMRMVTAAYSMLANGGRRIKPTLIDRIQDRWGKTIFRHDERVCQGCAPKWTTSRSRAGRQARAGARSDDRLSDHLDDGRRGPARHGDR